MNRRSSGDVRWWLIVAAVVLAWILAAMGGCGGRDGTAPVVLYRREFCLERLVVEDQVPGYWRAVSDSLHGAEACSVRWTFRSEDSTFARGDGQLAVDSVVWLSMRLADSTVDPPRDTTYALIALIPALDRFGFAVDDTSEIAFLDIDPDPDGTVNYWPMSQLPWHAQRWYADSVTVFIRNCFGENDECGDHFLLDATWRRS